MSKESLKQRDELLYINAEKFVRRFLSTVCTKKKHVTIAFTSYVLSNGLVGWLPFLFSDVMTFCYIQVANNIMSNLQNFNDKPVRTAWSDEQNKWYFSIVDVIAVLTESIDRALENYRRLGYSECWINQRLKSIEIRKELTDEWERVGVQ